MECGPSATECCRLGAGRSKSGGTPGRCGCAAWIASHDLCAQLDVGRVGEEYLDLRLDRGEVEQPDRGCRVLARPVGKPGKRSCADDGVGGPQCVVTCLLAEVSCGDDHEVAPRPAVQNSSSTVKPPLIPGWAIVPSTLTGVEYSQLMRAWKTASLVPATRVAAGADLHCQLRVWPLDGRGLGDQHVGSLEPHSALAEQTVVGAHSPTHLDGGGQGAGRAGLGEVGRQAVGERRSTEVELVHGPWAQP